MPHSIKREKEKKRKKREYKEKMKIEKKAQRFFS